MCVTYVSWIYVIVSKITEKYVFLDYYCDKMHDEAVNSDSKKVELCDDT